MKKFLSIILAVVMIASLIPAVFVTASAAMVAGDTVDYVFAHAAHTSTASNKGTTDTKLTAVGFDDMDYTVSSGAWGNATYRTDERAGLRSGALAVHRTGDFMNMSLTPATANFENSDTTATKGFFKFDTTTSSGALPIMLIRINVPTAGKYNTSITTTAVTNGQLFKTYLIKETTEVQATTAANIRASLSEADALGNFDSCLGGEQALATEVELEASPYLLAIVPNGMSEKSDPSKISSEIGWKLKSFSLEFVEELTDDLQSVSVSADNTALGIEGEAANLSVSGTYSLSGSKAIAASDVTFSVAPAGVVSVSADGVVSPVGLGTATVTATYGGKTDSVDFTVSIPEGYTQEYIFKLSAFNTEKMIKGASSAASATEDVPYHTQAAVLDSAGTKFYYRPAMNWNYTVPAKYSATDPQADFTAMNLDATDPWAFEAHKVNLGVPYIYSDAYAFEYAYNSYTGATPSFVAFRLKVDYPGEYDISVLSSMRQEDSPVTAVYFFKDGTSGVTNGDVSTYPASKKLGYYDLYNALKKYEVVGESVKVPSAGEYIIAFVGDANSQTLNTTTIGTAPNQQQRFYLSGVKLAYQGEVTDGIDTISIESANTALEVGDNTVITAKANYILSGEQALSASDVDFTVAPEGIVNVSSLGAVTAVSAGTATVTAALKSDPTKTATVTFNVTAPEANEEITGNSVSIALTAIANGVVSADAKALLSESSIVAGNINSVAVGSAVTLKAEDSDTLKFLYWYNGNSGRIISDEAEYTFTAGTNTPIYAKYADVNEELTEYFSAAGQLMEESEGTFDTEPTRTIGDYYKLFKETVSAIAYDAVEKISEAANFVCWTKDGKVVSYDKTYTYTPWTGSEVVAEVTTGEASDVPAVVLFENDGEYMLELVNFEGVEIVEKGILFAQSGTPTVDTCYAKVVANDNTNQFAASSEYGNARAYVIYKDGTSVKVAYSK